MGDIIYWVLVAGGAIAAAYVIAYIVSGAFFDRKMEYNRKLLRQLEERKDAEKE